MLLTFIMLQNIYMAEICSGSGRPAEDYGSPAAALLAALILAKMS
jgi:hypothetical protein